MSRNQRQLLRMSEAQELLGVSANTMRRWDKEEILKAIRINPKGNRRYKREDIEKLMERRQK